ncbi:hypothetical protein HFX_1221 [Haloferax mediterranei ATCC 33500]|uniref:Uncharacterized protein n=1 Tax=Haloferax mediterranei (strain ATCC 33500 / DSM 1411 / JCM 8866 / NBRC 14739 / NCIMB 2177 / R-4) TaxID=523841 RepID=I3R3X4_HALMT|nr:hypothetical protein HFX_1221 [Haloferax mediterranei ATCC 33500]
MGQEDSTFAARGRQHDTEPSPCYEPEPVSGIQFGADAVRLLSTALLRIGLKPKKKDVGRLGYSVSSPNHGGDSPTIENPAACSYILIPP